MHDASAHLTHGMSALGLSGGGGVVIALLIAGLVGGLAHCGATCGPFVLSQASARLAANPSGCAGLTRLSGAMLLPYHLGRITTYAALGALAAAAVGEVQPTARWVPVAFLLIGALLFMTTGARGVGLALPRVSLPWQGSMGTPEFTDPLRALAESPYGWRGYLMGVALGFLPCGLLYAAIDAVAGTGRPATAALGMAAFGLGTAPSLFAVGLVGHFAARRWRAAFGKIAPALLIVNGAALVYLAWRTMT
ncbi:MAG: sulfite exporter TauE/SafE family protein [Proteobacteria bacterium]|nr:sulfite exporter TauE/SafE family protein [Pseudomonadota bacterium]